MRRIPLVQPTLGLREWETVKACLESGWVSSAGPFVGEFERLVRDRVGVSYAVAMVNGTAALHIALLVAGVSPDDEVLVSDLTFIAPVNAIRYVGAWPVLVGPEAATWQMDPLAIERFVASSCSREPHGLVNRRSGRRVRAILPVHILGHPCDMDPILEVARAHQLVVIEDATESLGATYRGRPVGSLGDVACLSFNGNKMITTGGGGMLLTDREDLARKAAYLSTQAKDDPSEYVHGAIGYNYRLTGIQSALGCAQMERFDELLESKRRIAAAYEGGLRGAPGLEFAPEAAWAGHCWWMSAVRVEPKRAGIDRTALGRALALRGIETRPLWQPMHRSPAHLGARAFECDLSWQLHREVLCLPCSADLGARDQEEVISAILESVGRRGVR